MLDCINPAFRAAWRATASASFFIVAICFSSSVAAYAAEDAVVNRQGALANHVRLAPVAPSQGSIDPLQGAHHTIRPGVHSDEGYSATSFALGAPSVVPVSVFNLSPSDRRISDALRRFAHTHGWKLSWEIDRDFSVDYDATFTGSFLNVVEQLARSLQSVNTPIRVKAYHGNRVLRVLYATY